MRLIEFANRLPSRSAAGLLLLLLYGCTQTPTLVPAPGADVTRHNGTVARTEADGVTVTAETGAWRGDVDIGKAVTPMKVTLVNNTDRAVRVRYSDFALIGDDGKRYAALPPYGVRGSVKETLRLDGTHPINRLGFSYHYFSVAPHYRHVYPTLAPYTLNRLFVDPYYYAHYYPYWRSHRVDVELPTPRMLRRVLPEGVLEAGGELEGFLYFEKVDEDMLDGPVNFHADLTDAGSGEMFAMAHIPFVAQRDKT